MTNNAFVGRIFLARGDGGSPEVFARVCQVNTISGLGQTNALEDVTTFCSGGVKEYAAGLADGAEITFSLNFETVLPDAQVERDMINDVQNKATRDFEIQVEGTTPGAVDLTFAFAAKCISWTLKPSVSAKNQIDYAVKITGPVTYF